MCPLVSLFRSAGKVGKVVEDDRSAQPFKVKAKGKTWWYQRKALEKVTEEGCSDNDDEDDSVEDNSDNSSESGSDSPFSSPSTIVVKGGGGSRGSECNGTYEESGRHNGRPLFVHQNGKAKIYFNNFWKINYQSSTTGWVYGVDSAKGKGRYPPSAWRTDGYLGSDAQPCPTLKLTVVNRNGDVAGLGGESGGTGGFTGLNPRNILYCGKRKDECKCGSCDGVCGPNNGCPCQDCFALLKVFFMLLHAPA